MLNSSSYVVILLYLIKKIRRIPRNAYYVVCADGQAEKTDRLCSPKIKKRMTLRPMRNFFAFIGLFAMRSFKIFLIFYVKPSRISLLFLFF